MAAQRIMTMAGLVAACVEQPHPEIDQWETRTKRPDYNLLSLSFAPKAVTRPRKLEDARPFQESPPKRI